MHPPPRLNAIRAVIRGIAKEENTTARTGGEVTARIGGGITAMARIFNEKTSLGIKIRKKKTVKNPEPAEPGIRIGKITRRTTHNTNKIGVG